jgi:hypothetical protein
MDQPEKPSNEDEYLKRESRLAREALQRLRGEMLQSLVRTANVGAWTERYPWQSLGTAAVAGLGTGWVLGKTFHHKPPATETSATPTTGEKASAEAVKVSAPSRLVSGMGTIVGALASAAVAAAAEGLKGVVSNTVRDALNPDVQGPETEAQGSTSEAPPDLQP